MLRLMLEYEVPPERMVHALQNHDELMLETTPLRARGDRVFEHEGGSDRGAILFERIHSDVIDRTTGERGPYNEAFAMSPGVCATLPRFTAASLGYADVAALDEKQISAIRKRHLAAAAYNALQPGAFMVSGWDLVGAPPGRPHFRSHASRRQRLPVAEPGAYDLAGIAPQATTSEAGLPRAVSLYGSIPEQLTNHESFAATLKRMLTLRRELRIDRGRLEAAPKVDSPGLVLLLIELPKPNDDEARRVITAVNFGQSPLHEPLDLRELGLRVARIAFSTRGSTLPPLDEVENETPVLRLAPPEAQVLLLEP
jgi:trehalose synthase